MHHRTAEIESHAVEHEHEEHADQHEEFGHENEAEQERRREAALSLRAAAFRAERVAQTEAAAAVRRARRANGRPLTYVVE